MEIPRFLRQLTVLLLSHRKFKIKPIFGDGGKQKKAVVHISMIKLKALTSKKIHYLISICSNVLK